jgi:PKD domain
LRTGAQAGDRRLEAKFAIWVQLEARREAISDGETTGTRQARHRRRNPVVAVVTRAMRGSYTQSMTHARQIVFARSRGARRPWAALVVACAALAWSVLAIPVAWANHTASPAKTRYARIRSVCPPPAPGDATCAAQLREPIAATSAAAAASVGASAYTVNDGASSSGPSGGLTPAQLASAYGYQPTVGGGGQTVAIVDAFDDPKIEQDLAEFDSHYGLGACTAADGCFEKVGQNGSAKSLAPADTERWSVEVSLDVETVRAACQKCKILLVEANEPSFQDLADAVDEAVSKGATEVSNSYAGPEVGEGEKDQAAYNHPGVVIAAATGDSGYDSWDLINEGFPATAMPNTPASLPSVVAVGGTSLELNEDGTRASETVWNNNGPGDKIGLPDRRAEGASGGGCSTLFGAPLWQRDTPGFSASGCADKRLSADISAVGDPDTGFDIYDTYNCGPACEEFGIGKGSGWLTIGGTSLSTPLVVSLYALAGGADGVSYPALTLYGHLGDQSALFDVSEGANGFCGGESLSECDHAKSPNSRFGQVDCEATTACNAAAGFDGPSGVGSPRGLGAFKPLFPAAVITAPGAIGAGVGASFSASHSSDPYPGGSISTYSWEWGDGSADGSGVSPAHTFAAPGTYQVTLSVTDNYGLTSVPSTAPVTVSGLTPEEEAAAKQKAQEEEAAATAKHEEEAKQQEEALQKRTQKEKEEAGQQPRSDEAVHQEQPAGSSSVPGQERSPLAGNLQEVAAFHEAAAPAVPDAELASTALTARASGWVLVRVSCPARETRCRGTVTLRALDALGTDAARNRTAVVVTLAKGAFSDRGGQVKSVWLRLSPAARTLLRRMRALRVRVTILAGDPAGATHISQTLVTLRAAKLKPPER